MYRYFILSNVRLCRSTPDGWWWNLFQVMPITLSKHWHEKSLQLFFSSHSPSNRGWHQIDRRKMINYFRFIRWEIFHHFSSSIFFLFSISLRIYWDEISADGCEKMENFQNFSLHLQMTTKLLRLLLNKIVFFFVVVVIIVVKCT